MKNARLDSWLQRLRVTATFIYIIALCVAVAVLVIAFIPHSSVTTAVPAEEVAGLDNVTGVATGVTLDPAGTIAVEIAEPSTAQRFLYLIVVLPGLALVALIARSMDKLLGAALASDPFTPQTVRALNAVAKITAAGGITVWAMNYLATWALSATVLDTTGTARPDATPLAWLAVALIFAAFGQLIARGVVMRAELDTVI
jgi:small-conductance mechanosensitive channel